MRPCMSIDNHKLTMICCVGDCGRLNYLTKYWEIISMVSVQASKTRIEIQPSSVIPCPDQGMTEIFNRRKARTLPLVIPAEAGIQKPLTTV